MKQYIVTGMSCAACSARVEKAVGKVPGVESCSVSLLTNSMGVEGSASDEEIMKAFKPQKLTINNYSTDAGQIYEILGKIHKKWKPIPGRIKDYIAMPKPNMYQSLHTTVFGIDGQLFEIQIRTYEMDKIAEYGIASHWSYKENKGSKKEANLQNTTEQKLQFFKSIIELRNDKMSSEDFVNSVKDEVLNNNIYCFTPKGDVLELPKGSTPIDFAYRIHSGVGDRTVGAIVNDQIVTLDYELQDGDVVKINTIQDIRYLAEGVATAGFILKEAGVDPNTIGSTVYRGAHPGGTAPIGKIVDSNLKYVSFDIFDTLVVRPFLEPVDLFKLLDSDTSTP